MHSSRDGDTTAASTALREAPCPAARCCSTLATAGSRYARVCEPRKGRREGGNAVNLHLS